MVDRSLENKNNSKTFVHHQNFENCFFQALDFNRNAFGFLIRVESNKRRLIERQFQTAETPEQLVVDISLVRIWFRESFVDFKVVGLEVKRKEM